MNKKKGIYLALITAFISGIAIFINKNAVGSITPPLVFTATKNVGVGLLILGILLATKKWRKIRKLDRREAAYLILIGIIGSGAALCSAPTTRRSHQCVNCETLRLFTATRW